MSEREDTATLSLVLSDGGGERLVRRRWRVSVAAGPDRGRTLVRDAGRIIVGTHVEADLRLSDPTVSRYHAELRLLPEGVEVKDLDSKNGVLLRGRRVSLALLTPGERARIGESELAVEPEDEALPAPAEVERFGEFCTADRGLRRTLGMLRAAAATDTTVLLEGETGTGKELLARAVHQSSARARGPFVVVDCSSVHGELIESQLFGHKRGAFTGATADAQGAFEAASGGTLFLDELGELSLSLQPKLLRALEARAVVRLGEVEPRAFDVRVVAATNRDLERMVRERSFRADLYFRLAVVRLSVPPLRRRKGDVALLVEEHAARFAGKRLSPAALAALEAYDWPGNARELRNVLERISALAPGPVVEPGDLFLSSAPGEGEAPLGFRHAKDRVIADFERRYVESLLARHQGNVSQAAAEAGLSRNALYALMKRVGLEG